MSDWVGVVLWLVGMFFIAWLVRADARRARRDSYRFEFGHKFAEGRSIAGAPLTRSTGKPPGRDGPPPFDQDAVLLPPPFDPQLDLIGDMEEEQKYAVDHKTGRKWIP